jgi:hypothetical protein
VSDPALAEYFLAREPSQLPAVERIDVYRRLVRANLRSVISNAFPETREVLGPEKFELLFEEFLHAGGPNTPFYRDIPGDLVSWAGTLEHPLADLLQWEWLETTAARHPADLELLPPIDPLLIRPNPTMQLAVYSRPVDEFSAENPQPQPFSSPMAYLVWRRPRTDETETHRVGILLARGLALAAEQPQTAEAIAELLSAEAPGLDRSVILSSLREVERELRSREGIL